MAKFFKSKLSWSFVVVAVLVLICSCSVPAAGAQQTAVLNIDCGATAKYVDPVTGLTWVPDAGYISTGKNQAPLLPSSLANFTEMATLRYFDDPRFTKNCYSLPVTDGGTYLLRATFFDGDYDNANLPPQFQLAIDATVVANITATASGASYSEFHYIAQGNVSFVCLVRTSPSATPFISGISLKSANVLTTGYADQYGKYLQQGIIMKTRSRVNFGGSDIIRAPADYYDRFWFPEGLNSLYYLTPTIAAYEFLSTTLALSGLVQSGSWPPSAVMQTAVTSAGTLETLLWPQGRPEVQTSLYLSFYYAELNNSLAPLGLRNFTIGIPGLTSYSPTIDMSGYPFLDYGGWDFWLDAVTIGPNTTAVLTPLASDVAGPILNCLEVFERSDPRVSKTSQGDAQAIEDIKTSLNLTEWTGDPCLPVPHPWLTCSTLDVTTALLQPVILAVNLSGYQLVGSIPASFANLFDLTSLDLSSNDLSGSLLDWLATMKALRVLNVQNNNFSGQIPPALLSANSPIRFTYTPGNPFLIVPVPPLSAPVACSNCTTHKSNVAVIAGASAGGAVALLLIAGLAICGCRRWKQKKTLSRDQGTSMMRIATTGGAKAYTLAEVNTATSHFKRELGKGGFGPVYYGKLPDGQEVAVKVADGSSKHEEREFFNEVDVLSRVHHKNLVALVGYCQEQKQILIYEYMHNGSLFDHLHVPSVSKAVTLDWHMRLHIALNAAQGLEYLHTACSPSFIHRDVKSSNILLSPRYEAKVADFGLTRLLGEAEGTRVMTNVMGTAGYLDPEYYTSNYISSKSDVYSFGIVLLELITGSLPIDRSAPEGRNPNIVQWVRESLIQNNINSILDPAVKASNPNMEAIWKVAEVAMQSVEPKGIHRPTMTEVVQELQGALTIEATSVPPPLHSFVPPGFSEVSTGSYGPTSYPAPR